MIDLLQNFVNNRMYGVNPILDIPSPQQFETAVEAFPGTILVSVHDRMFIERFATSLWRIKDRQILKEHQKL